MDKIKPATALLEIRNFQAKMPGDYIEVYTVRPYGRRFFLRHVPIYERNQFTYSMDHRGKMSWRYKQDTRKYNNRLRCFSVVGDTMFFSGNYSGNSLLRRLQQWWEQRHPQGVVIAYRALKPWK